MNEKVKNIKFNGNTKNYFGIWISNIFLTIITIGIFSAWAKVRRICFFYENTSFIKDNFNYHATGLQILKGRLIVVLAIIAIGLISSINENIYWITYILFLAVLPYAFNKSMQFNLRMTSFRNIRFNWTGNYKGNFLVLIIFPFLSILSFGLMIPYSARAIRQYYFNNITFGKSKFLTTSNIKPYFIALLLSLIPLIFIIFLFAIFGLTENTLTPSNTPSLTASFIPLILILIFITCIFPIFKTLTRNIVINNLTLDTKISFKSSLDAKKIVWIGLSNFLVIIFSFGLMYPWAVIRMYKYLCTNTSIQSKVDLDKFVSEEKKKISSTGEEFVDFDNSEISI